MTTTQVPRWTLGDRLRKARGSLSQEAMAFKIGKRPTTIGGWENDLHKPSILELERWAQVTDTPLWWLLGYDEDPGTDSIWRDRGNIRCFLLRRTDRRFLDSSLEAA